MDHLPAPADPIESLPEVPYLCEEEPYHGGDFLTYTTRQGLPQLSSVNEAAIFRRWEENHPTVWEDKDVEEFLQAWLFFGLLCELLNKHGLFDTSDYVESNKSGVKCVHTRHLMDRLRSWKDIVQSWEQSKKDEELKHLCACLELAREAHYLILADHRSKCNRAIIWSVATILETIASTINLAFVGPEREVTVATARTNLNDAETNKMIRNGWCIHEILCAQKEFGSNSGRFYIQRLRRPGLEMDHSDCDTENCRKLQIEPTTYEPRHVVETCECAWSGPAAREVARCLKQDKFPVLRITGDEVGRIKAEVVPYVEGMVFVALSHVWADGLGNPRANRLPQCQLLRLRKLGGDVRDKKFLHIVGEGVSQRPEPPLVYPDGYQEIFVWCDTICCPVQDVDKPMPVEELTAVQTKAVARLRQVYETASYVLVLDRGLEQIDFQAVDRLESATRLFISRWVRRVWTFQEGGSCRRLLISFRDAIVDIRTVWGGVHHYASRKPEPHDFAQRRELTSHCFNLRSCFTLRSWYDDNNATLDYRVVIWSLCWRRVSFAADEALCLAAAYNLDTGAVSSQPQTRDARMQELWRQLAATSKGISAFIIFNALPRLSIPGFRWAPSSILQTVKQESVLEFVFREVDDSIGTLTPHGFRVNLSGWRVRPLGPPGDLPHDLIATGQPGIHYLRDSAGAWYSAGQHKELRSGRDIRLNRMWDKDREGERRSWNIILDSCPPDQEYSGRRGLATSSQHKEQGPTTQQSEVVVWVTKLAPQWTVLYELAFNRIYPLRNDPKIKAISTFAGQGFSIHDTFARVAIAKLPDMLTYTGSEEPTPPALYDLCKDLIAQIEETWKAAGQEKEIIEAVNNVHGGEKELGFIVKSVFMGRIAFIDEVFGEGTAWYVD